MIELHGDAGSIEIFGNDGAVALSVGGILSEKERALTVFSRGGAAKVSALEVHEMRSAWDAKSSE